MTDEKQTGYTVFAALGSVPVAERFEVSVRTIEDDVGRFWIDDSETNEGQGFDLAVGESAEYGGWTFEVTFLADDTAQFLAVSPDGQTYP